MEQILDRYALAAAGQKVTVFMLSSNREDYIGAAIKAVLEQTYRDFQLVILDNCSTDSTKQIVESFQDERIFFVQRPSLLNDPNYRFAFKVCATKYLSVLHDDDVVMPNYLETVLARIEKEGCATVSVSANIIDEHGNKTGRTFGHTEDTSYQGTRYFENFFSASPQGIVFPSAIYDHSFYRDIETFHDHMVGPAVDQYIWFQTERLGGRLCVLADKLIAYRFHSGQDSNQNAGFMDLMLIDYLLKSEYYLPLAQQLRKQITKRIWTRFRLISKKYAENRLDHQKYQSFFDYNSLSFMKETLAGRVYYLAMTFLYRCPWLTKGLIKLLSLRHK